MMLALLIGQLLSVGIERNSLGARRRTDDDLEHATSSRKVRHVASRDQGAQNEGNKHEARKRASCHVQPVLSPDDHA